MEIGSVVGSIDVAQVTLYAFWVFFALLVWYIRKEDRREGYPLEDDISGGHSKDPWLFVPPAKTFALPHGQGTVSVPDLKRDERPILAERIASFPGAPLVPTGNPLVDGVGPGSWAERADIADVTAEGRPRIVPMRAAEDFSVVEEDPNPVGMRVVGCDRAVGGSVVDIWVDRSEHLIRYLEVKTGSDEAGKTVLLPMNFCVLQKARGGETIIYVDAIRSDQFADVPGHADPAQITRLEEERVVAYYGGGCLYALPGRQESLL